MPEDHEETRGLANRAIAEALRGVEKPSPHRESRGTENRAEPST
jgi:hypothetical protein